MTTTHRVALLGFSSFERSTLASCFRLATRREPAYELADTLAQARFAVANADHAPTVLQVTQAGMVDETVFIGSRPPPGATAWMLRPIDPLHVMRELDAMVALAQSDPPELPAARTAAPAAAVAPAPSVPTSPAPTFLPTPLPGQRSPAAPHQAASRPAALSRPSLKPLQLTPVVPSSTTDTRHALLVDDSELALRFLASRLQPWGLQCTLAADSARALELMAQQHFDLVFLDVELGPDSAQDGLELCRHLRRQHPQHEAASPLLVLVSAHHSELDRARGALVGADAHLGKPLLEQELARLLRRQGLKPPAADPAPGAVGPPTAARPHGPTATSR